MEIEKAKSVIGEDDIVIFPTETAYGIAADALNRDAVEKVYKAKRRPREKGLTVIVASMEQAEQYTELSGGERKIVKDFMPGPLTLVTEKSEEVPENLNEKFVFRISSSEIARELAEEGPITATSANISGNETSYRVEDISQELREKAGYIINAGKLEQSPTSTIVEIVDGEVVIHREGPINKSEIEEIL